MSQLKAVVSSASIHYHDGVEHTSHRHPLPHGPRQSHNQKQQTSQQIKAAIAAIADYTERSKAEAGTSDPIATLQIRYVDEWTRQLTRVGCEVSEGAT